MDAQSKPKVLRHRSVRELYVKSHAIVIGISNYKNEKLYLKNTVNDAKEIAKILEEKYDFEVRLLIDEQASKQELEELFIDTIRGQAIGEKDRLLVYYAGHGVLRSSARGRGGVFEESFIVPFDAKPGSHSTYVNLDILTNNCQFCHAKHVLLILDSCYSGSALVNRRNFELESDQDDRYLAGKISKRSFQVIAATSRDQAALDGWFGSDHGAFTESLLQLLNNEFDPDHDGILTASEVGAYLEKYVPRSRVPQNPIYGHLPESDWGEFVFKIFSDRGTLHSNEQISSENSPIQDRADKITVLREMAATSIQNTDYRSARVFYDKILDLQPRDVDSLVGKGRSLYLEAGTLSEQGKYQEARECFERALALNPDNTTANTWNARTHNMLGKYQEAINFYNKAIALEPNSYDAIGEKAYALNMLGKYQEAIECFDKAIALEPEFSLAVWGKGEALRGLGKYQEAIKLYDKAIALEPEFSLAVWGKGEALRGLGKYQEAIECFDKAIALEPSNLDILQGTSDTLRMLGKYQEAIECAERATSLDPKSAQSYALKGYALYDLEKFQEAIDFLDKAIAIKPDYPHALNEKGYALLRLGNYHEAIHCFNNAISLDPDRYDSFVGKSISFRQLEKYQEAIECADKAIAINPDKSAAFESKGHAFYDLGMYQEAIDCFDKVLLINPGETEVAKFKKAILDKHKKGNSRRWRKPW
ncbi:MAG: tetratricopeptide repeat protein [Nitrososphaera sp.]